MKSNTQKQVEVGCGDCSAIRFVWDTAQNRPACVLLQSAYKADYTLLQRYFPPHTWLVAPTANMRMIIGSSSEWEQIAAKFNPPNAAVRHAAPASDTTTEP
jgi:hypothetical protein